MPNGEILDEKPTEIQNGDFYGQLRAQKEMGEACYIIRRIENWYRGLPKPDMVWVSI